MFVMYLFGFAIVGGSALSAAMSLASPRLMQRAQARTDRTARRAPEFDDLTGDYFG